MRRFLSNFPLHTFLVIYFVSFFLYAQNFELVDVSMMKRTLFYGTILSLLLFSISYLFHRNAIKSGITSTLILLLIFNYGVTYDGIEYFYYRGKWPFSNIHRYLLSFTLISCVTIVWFVQKKISTGLKINLFLNLLVLMLVVFNLSKIIVLNMNSEVKTEIPVEVSTTTGDAKPLPNIYYVILDGYANQRVLKKYYNYDNSAFIDFLKHEGFYVADSSFANYFSTMSSLSGTFNMDYLYSATGDQRRHALRNNRLFPELKRKGYKLYNMESGYSVTSGFSHIDSTIAIASPNEFERSVLKFTIFRLDELFGIIQHRRLKSQIEKLDEIVKIPGKQKFVFIHLVAPHPPFIFNSKGERVFKVKNHDNSWEPRQNYVEQLRYMNDVIKKFVSGIIRNDKQGVIILQSDHGPWIETVDKAARFESRSMILNAIRAPGGNQVPLYPGISSVNTFRFIIRNYFDASYALMPDVMAGKGEIMESIFFTKTK
jgi:hypothetical protein